MERRRSSSAPKNYFRLHFVLLKLMGIAIEDVGGGRVRSVLYWAYSAFFLTSCVIIFTACEIMHLVQNIKDLDSFTFTLCYLLTQFSGICKGTLILIQRKHIRNYCRSLETGHFLPSYNRGGTNEFAIVKRAVRASNAQAYIFHAFVVTIVANRGFYAALDDGVYEQVEVANATVIVHRHIQPYKLWFPFDAGISPYYEVAFAYQMIAITLYGLLIGTCDALITAFMVHLKAQLIILSNSLGSYARRATKSRMEEFARAGRTVARVQEYIAEYVGECVSHHQQIIILAEQAESEFSLLMLVQFLSSLLLLCFQLFQLSLYDQITAQFFSMVNYLCLTLFQLLIYCWNGDQVQVESLNVAIAAYESDWLLADASTQKALMLLMRRAQRPIRMSAGNFAYLSLETFTTILRGSGSYYMVLRKVNE